jgi:hypothetical protein
MRFKLTADGTIVEAVEGTVAPLLLSFYLKFFKYTTNGIIINQK